MKNLLTQIKSAATRLHRDEQGAEGLEKLLIIAAIVLPLLGLLIVFRGAITEYVTGSWEDVTDDADFDEPTLPQP